MHRSLQFVLLWLGAGLALREPGLRDERQLGAVEHLHLLPRDHREAERLDLDASKFRPSEAKVGIPACEPLKGNDGSMSRPRRGQGR